MAKISYYTQAGLDKLEAQLKELRTTGRARVAAALAEARDKGDLSENAEYDAAKEAQRVLEAKIHELETELSTARVLDEHQVDTSRVSILSEVVVEERGSKSKFTYQLVSGSEANMRKGKISIDSPIGKGLLGKRAGEEVTIQVPAGHMTFKVLHIGLPTQEA